MLLGLFLGQANAVQRLAPIFRQELTGTGHVAHQGVTMLKAARQLLGRLLGEARSGIDPFLMGGERWRAQLLKIVQELEGDPQIFSEPVLGL